MVDWPGLLKWTLTQADQTSLDPNVKPMSEQETKWLQEALESFSFDAAKRMREVLADLNTPEVKGGSEEEAETRLVLAEELTDLVEGLENARDLIRMGVYTSLLNAMFSSQYPEVRKALYFVFASCNSLNSFVQNVSLEKGGFQLINCVIKESRIDIKEAAFAALSSLVRGDVFSIKRRFIDVDGIDFLFELLQNDKDYKSNKIKTKVITLLQDLVFYDDRLDFTDIVAYNKSIGFEVKENDKGSHHISLKDDEKKTEESKQNTPVETQESLAVYKNVVKKKLIEKDLVSLGLKFLTTENLMPFSTLRTAYYSVVLDLLKFDSSLKLPKEFFEKISQVQDQIKKEATDDFFDAELDLIRTLLSRQ